MSTVATQATGSSTGLAPESNQVGWLSTKELRPLMWTTIVAICAGLMHILGAAVESGRLSALGMYGFSPSILSEEYLIYGAIAVVAISAPAISAVVIAILGLKLVSTVWHWASAKFGLDLPGYAIPTAWWTALIVVVVGFGAVGAAAFDLARQADGMIIKSQQDLGSTWMSMVLDEDGDWFALYWFGLCGGAAVLAIIAHWVASRVNVRRYKILFLSWLVLQGVSLCSACAYILGATQTINRYPVVTFSNAQQMLGKSVLPILLGEDDKQYAVLIAPTCSSVETSTPTVLYLPRTEVKWMIVLKQEPVHVLAHLRELAKNSLKPCSTDSSPPISGSPPK